jgi:hypothetical protein
MILHDSIHIQATPQTIYRFFDRMEEHYRQWHPDHVLFRWITGRGVAPGNVFYFEEFIAGKLLKKRVAFTRCVPGEHVEFVPTFWLMRLFLPRMLFRIELADAGCRLVAEVHLRMGPLGVWAHKKELAAVREHMRVEGLNAKRIIEASGEAASS